MTGNKIHLRAHDKNLTAAILERRGASAHLRRMQHEAVVAGGGAGQGGIKRMSVVQVILGV
jgi:hypothetical protein